MSTQRFWKCVSVTAIVALFYVGHGLHRATGNDFSLVSECFGQQVITFPGGVAHGRGDYLVTSDSSGTTLHFWTIGTPGSAQAAKAFMNDSGALPFYIGAVQADTHKLPGR